MLIECWTQQIFLQTSHEKLDLEPKYYYKQVESDNLKLTCPARQFGLEIQSWNIYNYESDRTVHKIFTNIKVVLKYIPQGHVGEENAMQAKIANTAKNCHVGEDKIAVTAKKGHVGTSCLFLE